MLSDHEAAEIERKRRQGAGGPVVLTWIDRLLQDRKERVRQLEHLRQRLRQAFIYFDKLLRDPPPEPPRTDGPALAGPIHCPKCGRPYVRASSASPTGIVYIHKDRSECRA
jgi:hypothetical protein